MNVINSLNSRAVFVQLTKLVARQDSFVFSFEATKQFTFIKVFSEMR
jgi:hypothetical protein